MRIEARLASAVLASLLLHSSVLVLFGAGTATRRQTLPAELTVTLPSSRPTPAARPLLALPGHDAAALPSPPAPLPAAPVPQRPEPAAADAAEVELPSSLPSWVASFGPASDLAYYKASELDVRAEPLDLIEPEMPSDLPAGVRQGRVTLEVLIDEFGAVAETRVLAADPPGWFDQAAQRAFAEARWQPALREGRQVKSRKLIEVCFGGCPLDPAVLYNEGSAPGAETPGGG